MGKSVTSDPPFQCSACSPLVVLLAALLDVPQATLLAAGRFPSS